MKKIIAIVYSAFAVALSAFAELPSTNIKYIGYANGYLSLYLADRPALVSGTGVSYELQLRASDADEWQTVKTAPVSTTPNFVSNGYNGGLVNYKMDLTQKSVQVRVRIFKDEEYGEWMDGGTVQGYLTVRGTVIGNSAQADNALDGNMNTMIDESGHPWTGFDFGEPTKVKGVRIFARADSCGNRVKGLSIEAASSAAFTDTQVLHVNQINGAGLSGPIEVWFEEPVECGAIRLNSVEPAMMLSIWEWEVVPADVSSVKPTVAVTYDTLQNFNAQVSWTLPAGMQVDAVRVYRSTSVGSMGRVVMDWADAATVTSFTDETCKVCVNYFYRVEVRSQLPGYEGQTSLSKAMEYRRLRRLERSWADETKLLDGVTLMTPTNGNVSAVAYAKAFDGNVSTWPDNGNAAYGVGPVGVQFSEKAWVGKFAYVHRNDGWCYARIKCAALCATMADDQPELLNKVQVSECASQYVENSTQLYVQDVTTVLEGGADCYFLYQVYSGGGYTFCANVAELMLFGWTQSDIDAAGETTAPTEVNVAHASGVAGLQVTWAGALNPHGFVVQRRAAGESEWSNIATLESTALSYTDTSVTTGTYVYRVAAKDDNDELQQSAEVQYIYYTPGDGTGLRGTIMWPYISSDAAQCFPPNKVSLGDGAVNFKVADGASLVSGEDVKSNVRLEWRGKLIVPIAGAYTITLETSDGGAVCVDGVFVANSWNGGTKNPSGMVNLTTGEHDILVCARLESTAIAGYRKCVLKWSGPVNEEVIPVSQLKPSTEEACTVNGWNIANMYNWQLGYAFYQPAQDNIRVQASNYTYQDNSKRNMVYVYKPWTSGAFEVSMRLTRNNGGIYAGPMVMAPDGSYLMVYYNDKGSTEMWYGVRLVRKCSTEVEDIVPAKLFGNEHIKWYSTMKIVYARGVFHCYWKWEEADEWTELVAWENDGTFDPHDVRVGAAAYNNSNTSSAGSIYYFNNLLLKDGPKGMAIFLR